MTTRTLPAVATATEMGDGGYPYGTVTHGPAHPAHGVTVNVYWQLPDVGDPYLVVDVLDDETPIRGDDGMPVVPIVVNHNDARVYAYLPPLEGSSTDDA